MLVGAKSCNQQSERVDLEQDRSQEKMNSYKLEREAPTRILLQKEVRLKATKRCIVSLEKRIIGLEKEKSFLVKTHD